MKRGSNKKTIVKPYNPFNFSLEPGTIVVDTIGRAFRLIENKLLCKSAAGELSLREIKNPGFIATIKDNRLIWVKWNNKK